MSYFHLLNNFVGEVYFRVSKHLGIKISEVMYGFFIHDIDILMLMRKYGEEIKWEKKRAHEIEREAKKSKFKKHMRRK